MREVHLYQNGHCEVAEQPEMPDGGETRWVTAPYEPDPRTTAASPSWHNVAECPFKLSETGPSGPDSRSGH